MSDEEYTRFEPGHLAINPVVSGGIFLMMIGLALGGFLAYRLLQQPVPPAPAEVVADRLLSEGRDIFLGRCATCHGVLGRGDGPIAGNLAGPPVGNLTDAEWKHGDRPDQVLAVIENGVPGTRMEGWSRVLDPPQAKAVASYVYYLAKRPVPDELRPHGS